MVPAEVRAAEEPRGLKENQNNLFFLFVFFFLSELCFPKLKPQGEFRDFKEIYTEYFEEA